MSYLHDRKKRNKKIRNIFLVFLFLSLLFYFRSPILNTLSSGSNIILKPFFMLTNNIGTRMHNFSVLFNSKQSLLKENEDLKNTINENQAKVSEHDSLLKENQELKEILGRIDENKDFVLATIIKKPGIFDTLLLDVGESNGVKQGDLVFAYGNIPIGYISEVYNKSSSVNLFSKNGEKTNVILDSKDIYLELIGRGGGNFEIILPRDLSVEKGENFLLTNIKTYVIAKVESIISDPRDSFQKALLVSPINTNQLKFVEVERSE